MAYGPNANENTWFYEKLCLEVVIVMVKDKKYSIKDTVSIKIMHPMKWTRESNVTNSFQGI